MSVAEYNGICLLVLSPKGLLLKPDGCWYLINLVLVLGINSALGCITAC